MLGFKRFEELGSELVEDFVMTYIRSINAYTLPR
jgi:hypothetical protein